MYNVSIFIYVYVYVCVYVFTCFLLSQSYLSLGHLFWSHNKVMQIIGGDCSWYCLALHIITLLQLVLTAEVYVRALLCYVPDTVHFFSPSLIPKLTLLGCDRHSFSQYVCQMCLVNEASESAEARVLLCKLCTLHFIHTLSLRWTFHELCSAASSICRFPVSYMIAANHFVSIIS